MLEGVLPVIPTPFTEDGSEILYNHFAALCGDCIDQGAAGLVLFGGGGEFVKLTPAERDELLRTCVQTAAGRVPVVATVTEHSVLLAQRQAEHYLSLGADVLNIMPPSFGAPTPAMVKEHTVAIAKTAGAPVVLQYAPALTGGLLTNETLAEIAEGAGRPMYIKIEATPTGPAITSLLDRIGDKYKVLIGNGGECLYEALQRGAVGVMPGAALTLPYVEIIKAWQAGNGDKAWRLYTRFLPYLHFAHRHIEEFVAMEKILLVWRGLLPNSAVRAPGIRPDAHSEALLRRIYGEVCAAFYPGA